MISPENNIEEAMQKLFTAKWNIPQAVSFLGKPACKEEWEAMKEEFRKFCLANLPTFTG